MDAVAAQATDTAATAQPPAAPPVEIEVVDTPVAAPEAAAPEAPPALIFGKYRSVEDAEKAYSEAQRAMHEKSQEAATYRKLLEERQAQPATPSYQAPPVDMDSQFRERLAENPAATIFEMTKFAAKQMLDEQQRSQRESLKRFQSYASRPEYASVAQQVASQLPFAEEQPIDPVEGQFLRARLRQLEEQIAGGGGAQRPAATPPFVLPGGVQRTGTGSNRVELDPDTARLRGMGQDKVRDLARMVAKQKMAGGTMREMSIDDWEASNA